MKTLLITLMMLAGAATAQDMWYQPILESNPYYLWTGFGANSAGIRSIGQNNAILTASNGPTYYGGNKPFMRLTSSPASKYGGLINQFEGWKDLTIMWAGKKGSSALNGSLFGGFPSTNGIGSYGIYVSSSSLRYALCAYTTGAAIPSAAQGPPAVGEFFVATLALHAPAFDCWKNDVLLSTVNNNNLTNGVGGFGEWTIGERGAGITINASPVLVAVWNRKLTVTEIQQFSRLIRTIYAGETL